MTTLQALFLGLVQGATEFIPISSSGHLVLIPWLLGWDAAGLTFEIAVHVGTMVAVLFYFREDWGKLIRAGLRWLRYRDNHDPYARLFFLLIIGTLPAALIGVSLRDWFEQVFGQPIVAALLLLVTATLLFVGERLGRLTRTIENLRWSDALLIGLGQALAIFPGISRSGATIAAGRMLNLRRRPAARLSFLLATPLIMGVGFLRLLEVLGNGTLSLEAPDLLAGFVGAAIMGYIAIRWLLRYLETRSTMLFSIYCLLMAVLCLTVFVIRSWL